MANETEKEKTKDPKGSAGTEQKKSQSGAEAKPATLTPLEPKQPTASQANLDFLLDVPLKVNVHVGGVRMLIRDLLQLGRGSVVELEKVAGEAMDVLIGDKLIARGEIVVVNEKFGVRLTDIVSPTERINQLSKG